MATTQALPDLGRRHRLAPRRSRSPWIRPSSPTERGRRRSAARRAPCASGRTSASASGRSVSPARPQPRFVRFNPSRSADHDPGDDPGAKCASDCASAPTPNAITIAATPTASRSSRPWRIPHPIEPKINSPRNSGKPTASRSPAAIPAPIGDSGKDRDLLDLVEDSPISALPSSTWAPTSRCSEAFVAPICSRRLGGSSAGGRSARGSASGAAVFGSGSGGGSVSALGAGGCSSSRGWAPVRRPGGPADDSSAVRLVGRTLPFRVGRQHRRIRTPA